MAWHGVARARQNVFLAVSFGNSTHSLVCHFAWGAIVPLVLPVFWWSRERPRPGAINYVLVQCTPWRLRRRNRLNGILGWHCSSDRPRSSVFPFSTLSPVSPSWYLSRQEDVALSVKASFVQRMPRDQVADWYLPGVGDLTHLPSLARCHVRNVGMPGHASSIS